MCLQGSSTPLCHREHHPLHPDLETGGRHHISVLNPPLHQAESPARDRFPQSFCNSHSWVLAYPTSWLPVMLPTTKWGNHTLGCHAGSVHAPDCSWATDKLQWKQRSLRIWYIHIHTCINMYICISGSELSVQWLQNLPSPAPSHSFMSFSFQQGQDKDPRSLLQRKLLHTKLPFDFTVPSEQECQHRESRAQGSRRSPPRCARP